jgi:CRP/FNR family transcriptional regulator
MLQKEDIDFTKGSLSFWKELSQIQRNTLQEYIIKKQFVTGESMHSNSEHCSGLFLIRSGQVRAYIVSESGKEITLYRLTEGEVCIFSASCIMKNIAFDILIEVEKDTEAYLIPTLVFKKLSEESLPVQIFSNNLMATRFSEALWVMEQALFTSFDKRLAGFLVEQVELNNSKLIEITHEKIANHLGTAREVVTRMLKYFQNEGMVAISRGSIEITNLKKLELLING